MDFSISAVMPSAPGARPVGSFRRVFVTSAKEGGSSEIVSDGVPALAKLCSLAHGAGADLHKTFS